MSREGGPPGRGRHPRLGDTAPPFALSPPPGAAGFRTPRPADPWPDNLALARPTILPQCRRGEGAAASVRVSSLWHPCACMCASVRVYAYIHVCSCVCPRARLRVRARARACRAPLRGDADAGKDRSCSFLPSCHHRHSLASVGNFLPLRLAAASLSVWSCTETRGKQNATNNAFTTWDPSVLAYSKDRVAQGFIA